MKPRIKICCISSIDEAKTAIEYGASAIGLVAKMPSGPGPISDDLIRQAIEEVQPFGVDVCTGVRTNDHLDKQKLDHFFFEALKIKIMSQK